MRIDGNDEFYINQYKIGYMRGHYDGYNKAIDDFVNACKEDILCQTFGLHQNGIEKIAQQLKESCNK